MTAILEGQLDDAFDRIPGADRPQTWRVEHRVFPDDRLILTDDGQVRVFRRFEWWVRWAYLGLIVLAPLLVTSLWAVPLYLAASVIANSHGYNEAPAPACTEITTDRVHGTVGITLLLALVPGIVQVITAFPHWTVTLLCGAALGIVATDIYLQDGIPFVSPDLAKRPMTIPFRFLTESLGVTLLFFPVVALAVFFDRLGVVLGSYAEGETNRATASILADLTGGWEGPPLDPDPEAIRQAVLEPFSQVLQIVFMVVIIMLGLGIHGSKTRVEWLYRYRLRPFRSRLQRFATFLVFLGFIGVLYATMSIAVGILLYGVTGVYYLPASTLSPFHELLPAELSTSSEGLLAGLYRTLDYTLANVPVVSARTASLAFLCTLLWPFVFVAFGTIAELLGRPYRALRVLHLSDPVADVQSLVADDIQVRSIDCCGYPDLRPLSVLFGAKEYVIVSGIVLEECPRDELEALLRHEQYHLQERSLGFGATVLSSVLGGANLLPAFYDFRESERKADAAAAEAVGVKPLRHAIIRLYDLQARAGSNPIAVLHPGAIGTDTTRPETTQIRAEASAIGTRVAAVLWSFLVATYQLYFGGILLDTAHMRKKERLDALRENH